VARNLAIVLGQQGLPQVLRPLQALSNHPHPKVSCEALRAFKRVQTSLSNTQGEQERGAKTVLNLRDSPKREKSYGAGCP